MNKIDQAVEMVRAAGYTVDVANVDYSSRCGSSSYFTVHGQYTIVDVRISDHSCGAFRAMDMLCLTSSKPAICLAAEIIADVLRCEPLSKAALEKDAAERAERRRIDAELKAAAAARKAEKAARRAALNN